MKNSSLNVLKNFTRKLVNCRYMVAVDALVEDLKNGGFGYSVVKSEKQVATNDFVLADDFETLLESIRVIFRAPRMHLKKENVVMRAEAASKYDVSTLKATYRDEKLWRVKEDGPSPEYVHTFVHEDDCAVYENKFVCFVIDEVLEQVSKKINSLAESIVTLNKKLGADKKDVADWQYVDYLDVQMPVLITDEDANAKILQSLIKSKKWLISLKNTPLYMACKKAEKFNPLGLKPTNILTQDPVYRRVYQFYLNYLNKEPVLQSEQGMYLGYVTVNLFSALKELGFNVADETRKVGVTNLGVLRFSKVVFSNGMFKIVLSQEEDAIIMTVITPDENQGKYVFKVLSNSQASEDNNFTTVENYVKGLLDADGVVKTFVINDIDSDAKQNAIYVAPTMTNTVEVLTKALKTCLLIGVGSAFMYARYCPVCGSNLIATSEEGCLCNSCKTLYHVFEYEEKGYVWFKNFAKQK